MPTTSPLREAWFRIREPGETKPVQFKLTPRDFAYFDVAGQQWKADPGEYQIEIGASSRDIRLTAPLRLVEEFTDKVNPMPLNALR